MVIEDGSVRYEASSPCFQSETMVGMPASLTTANVLVYSSKGENSMRWIAGEMPNASAEGRISIIMTIHPIMLHMCCVVFMVYLPL